MYYNKCSEQLQTFKNNSNVFVRDGNKTRHAKLINAGNNLRAYEMLLDNGHVFDRNIRFILKGSADCKFETKW